MVCLASASVMPSAFAGFHGLVESALTVGDPVSPDGSGMNGLNALRGKSFRSRAHRGHYRLPRGLFAARACGVAEDRFRLARDGLGFGTCCTAFAGVFRSGACDWS